MFDFMNMAGNYDSRKVDRFETGDLLVSTCSITDSDFPFETAVAHSSYNHGDIVIVEHYYTLKEAQKGHERWVKTMTTDPLPDQLLDVSTSTIAKMATSMGAVTVHPKVK